MNSETGTASPATPADRPAGPRRLFDRRLGRLRMERAARIDRGDADFLVEEAAGEIVERLAATNRSFRDALDLATPSPLLRRRLAAARPGLAVNVLARIADDDDLGLAPQSLDLVFSAFGLGRIDDLPGVLVQVRRALRPDGLFLAALPAEGTLGELRDAAIAAETRLAGGAALRVEPAPDVRQLGALLLRTGFALPVADLQRLTLRYRDAGSLVADLRSMGGTSVLAGSRPRLPRGFGQALGEEYARLHADGDGRIRATFNIAYLTGWAPHESQQKPLRPGSATARLADAMRRKD